MRTKINWEWQLEEDGTLQIFGNDYLCWELVGYKNYTNLELNIIVKEFILQNQYVLNENF